MPAKTSLNALTLSPDGRWAIVSPEFVDKLGILDLNQRRWVKFFECDRSSYASFEPDSQTCWIDTLSDLWRVDMHTLEVIHKLAHRGEPGGLGMVDATADGRMLATLDTM